MLDKESKSENALTNERTNERTNGESDGSFQISIFDIEQGLNGNKKYVREISYGETKPFLLKMHYARRMPCITNAFGLFVNEELIGVVTYGVPASHPLCIGIAGIENQYNVLELNRLVIKPDSGKNNASYLVSRSLKMLPNKTFVVSYADTAWTHIGYVYQATNFLYTGMSAKRNDSYQPDGLHPRAYDKNSHSDLKQTRSAKHRYVYLVGDKRTKKQMLKELKYKIVPEYPKGDERKYDINNPIPANPIKVITKGEKDETDTN